MKITANLWWSTKIKRTQNKTKLKTAELCAVMPPVWGQSTVEAMLACVIRKSKDHFQAAISISKRHAETHALPRFSSRVYKAANARISRGHNANFGSDATPGPGSSGGRVAPAINQH